MAAASSSLTSSVHPCLASLSQVGEESVLVRGAAFVFSNEIFGAAARKITGSLSRFHGGFYFGVSCLENYSHILAVKPQIALIVDASEDVMRVHRLAQECLLKASTRFAFIEVFIKRLLEERIQLEDAPSSHASQEAWLFSLAEQELQDSTSWLGSDVSYEQMRRYIAERRMICLRRKISSNEFFSKLNEWLNIRGFSRRVFYFSNMLDWVALFEKQNQTERMEFIRTYIAPALNKSSLVIDSCLNSGFVAKYKTKSNLNALVYRGPSFAAGDLSSPIVEIIPDDEDEKESVPSDDCDGDVFDVIPLPDPVAVNSEDGDALDALAEAGLLDLSPLSSSNSTST